VSEIVRLFVEAAAIQAWRDPRVAARLMVYPSRLAVIVLCAKAFPQLFQTPDLNAPGGDC
jgi:hypothetical protein